jgi:hypothetical protein
MKKIVLVTSLLLSFSASQAFDFGGFMDKMKDAVPAIDETIKPTKVEEKPATQTTTTESPEVVANALKEALGKGVEYAVQELGKEGGYLNNNAVKIPLPEGLSGPEEMIRKVGGDKIADDFIISMNTAAQKAALKATPIFVKAINGMSIEDAKAILAGPTNAATEYFKARTTEDLKAMMKPIVIDTMEENNVASYYDTLNEYYHSSVKQFVENDSVVSMAKNFGMEQYFPGKTTEENLDDYVTRNAIDGLFVMIAKKEAEIRGNPIAQKSSLLQKVFGKL